MLRNQIYAKRIKLFVWLLYQRAFREESDYAAQRLALPSGGAATDLLTEEFTADATDENPSFFLLRPGSRNDIWQCSGRTVSNRIADSSEKSVVV